MQQPLASSSVCFVSPVVTGMEQNARQDNVLRFWGIPCCRLALPMSCVEVEVPEDHLDLQSRG